MPGVNFTIPSAFIAVDRFSNPMMKMGRAVGMFVNRAEVGMARVERAFRRAMAPLTAMQNSLRGMGVYIGLFTAVLLARSALNVMADFEQAQVDIAAVTGQSVDKNKMLADQARVLALRYGQAASSVLALDLALIKAGYAQRQITQMIEPITTGAVALKAEPESLGKIVNAILKSFKMPESETKNVVDLMTKAADLSTMDWPDIETMLPRAMQTASLAGMSFKELLSLFAAARDAQVHVASGSVAIKNMLIQGAIHGKTFQEMMDKIIESPNSIRKAYKMFGPRSLVTALPLAEAQKMKTTEDFMKKLEATFRGYSEQVAKVRLDSIRGRLALMRRSWEELIIAIDDGRGPLGNAIKQYLDVASAMLLISADSDQAKDKLSQMDKTVIELANKYLTWAKIIATVIGLFILMRLVLIAWNVVLFVGKALLFAWSVALGVAAAMGWANVMSLKGNIVAITVLRGATAIATAAQWAWNVALMANPIGLVIAAVLALIGVVYLLADNYYEWGAALTFVIGPMGVMLNLIEAFARNWQMIKDAFSVSFVDGIKAIGKAILSAILYPLEQTYLLISKLTGFQWADKTYKMIELTRAYLEKDMTPEQIRDGMKDIVYSKVPLQQNATDSARSQEPGRATIEILNRSGHPVNSSGTGLQIKMDSTMNY